MEIKSWLVNAFTVTAFTLQLVFCAGLRNDGHRYLVALILCIVAHSLYFVRVIRRGENQYKRHFFNYQIGVASFQFTWVSDFYNITNYAILIVLPLSVQVSTCFVTYLHNRQTAGPYYINEEDNEGFKKGLVHAISVIAFPLQLTFYGIAIASYSESAQLFVFTALITVSVLVNIVHFLRVIRTGKNEYEPWFFYHQVVATIIQLFKVEADTRFHFVLPFIVQVIACTSIYFHSENTPSGGLPSHIETEKMEDEGEKKIAIQCPEAPVVEKS